MTNKSNSVSVLVLAFLLSARNGRRFHQIIREYGWAKNKKDGVSVALSRMQKTGYIKNSTEGWILTERGRTRGIYNELYSYIQSPFKKDALANTIVAFDIGEKDRRIRTWLRNQLKIFDYKMLQKSLWLGPGPLPKTFQHRLEKLDVKKNVKTFTIVKKQK